jgi:hypothetical protein
MEAIAIETFNFLANAASGALHGVVTGQHGAFVECQQPKSEPLILTVGYLGLAWSIMGALW